jgi:hypothetical protein
MYKVYFAISRAMDKQLGYVREDGTIYQSKVGLDERLGKVDLASGKVFEDRFGPDKTVGYVDLKNGKVYLSRFGPDKYVGNVDGNGRMHRHVPMATDEYIGKIEPFISYAHSAGAMLLLVLPALDETEPAETPDQATGE